MDYRCASLGLRRFKKGKVNTQLEKQNLNWKTISTKNSENPIGRWKHAAVVASDGCLYMYGGRSGNQALKDLWRFQPSCACGCPARWNEILLSGSNPPPLEQHSMIAHCNQLILFGGSFGYTDCDDAALWMININITLCRQWQPSREVLYPCTRRGHSAVVHREAMHVFGGYIDLRGCSAELWSFDFATESWHLTWSLCTHASIGPSARHGHSAVMHDSAMWVLGGETGLQLCSDLWRWSFRIGQWCQIQTHHGHSRVPIPFVHHAAVVDELNDIMLVSGTTEKKSHLATLWTFHFATNCWQAIHKDASNDAKHHSLLLFAMAAAMTFSNLCVDCLSPRISRQAVVRLSSRASADSAYHSTSTSRCGSWQRVRSQHRSGSVDRSSHNNVHNFDNHDCEEDYNDQQALNGFFNHSLSASSLNKLILSDEYTTHEISTRQIHLLHFGSKEHGAVARSLQMWITPY